MLPTLARRAASASASASTSTPTHYLITLVRSARGLPPRSGATLEALGLHRLHQSVLQEHSAAAAGKILRVKELITVRNVTAEEGAAFLERRRPEGSGVVSTGRVFGGRRP
jgi:ribosomal protein L30